MADRKVAIRLQSEGKADVVRDFRDIGDAGVAEANRWSRAFEKAGDDGLVALRRQADAAAKLAAIVPQTPAQQIYQAGASTNYSGPSARDSAAAIREQLDLQDQLQARAIKLREELDPLYVAQKKYDDELKNAAELKAAGKISDELYEKAVIESTAALNQAKRAVDQHSNSLGLNRTQFLIAEGAAHRFIDSLAAGMSPMRAFMLQAGDLGNILALDDGGVSGGLAKVKALLNPTTLGVVALTGVVALGVAAWYSYSTALGKLDALSQGSAAQLGLTGEQLRQNAELSASAAHITVSAAADIQKAYVGITQSGEVLADLTSITKDFAAATGQDVKAAAAQLGRAFDDPIAGATDLAEKYGMVSQAQADHIAKLAEEGDKTGAQKALYDAIQGGLSGASERAQGFAGSLDRIWQSANSAYESVGRLLDRWNKSGVLNQIVQFSPASSLSQYFPAAGQSMPAAPNNSNAASTINRTRAASALGQFQGDNRDSLRRSLGVINQGIAAGGDPDQIKALTSARDAYTRAIQTWIPAAQKANELAAADAAIAKAKTPAAKAEAAAEKERIQAKGEVVTAADLESRAQDKATAAAARGTKSNAAHELSLRRQAEAMDVAAQSALGVGDAYLKSSAAGIEAEARAKAAVDATRKGIDIEAQTRRQLALSVADGIKAGDKSVAQLRDEAVARLSVNDGVAAGKIAASDLNNILSDEAALRPLLTLRTLAHGDALDRLNKTIVAYRAALKAAHDEENRSQALQDISSANREVSEIKASIADLSKSASDQAIDAARRAASQRADDLHLHGQDSSDYIDAQVRKARADNADSEAREFLDQSRRNTNNLALAKSEIDLIGKSADQHDLIIARLQREQDLRSGNNHLSEADIQALLAQGGALDEANLKLRAMNDNWQEIKGFGDGFIDDVLNPSNWDNWGDAGKRILQDLESEFLKLAVINPIKNFLFGENGPTLGGVLGSIGKIGGAHALTAHATGSEYAEGGLSWVGEHGPELVNLPRGSKISTASQSARIAASAHDNRGAPTVIINANDAVLAETVRDWVSQGIQIASTRGAAGGAQLAKRERYRDASRQIPS